MTAIHNNQIDLDFIQGTIGQIANTERVKDKLREDYKTKVYLRRTNSVQPHLHHTIISNFKKRYGIELYIPAEKMGAASGNPDGVPDDIYFARLCKAYFDSFILGEMCVNTGKQSASTWATDISQERTMIVSDYNKRIDKLIGAIFNINWVHKGKDTMILDRVQDYIELLGEYKPRKKQQSKTTDLKYDLFC